MYFVVQSTLEYFIVQSDAGQQEISTGADSSLLSPIIESRQRGYFSMSSTTP
jgi:hypothetical protein